MGAPGCAGPFVEGHDQEEVGVVYWGSWGQRSTQTHLSWWAEGRGGTRMSSEQTKGGPSCLVSFTLLEEQAQEGGGVVYEGSWGQK